MKKRKKSLYILVDQIKLRSKEKKYKHEQLGRKSVFSIGLDRIISFYYKGIRYLKFQMGRKKNKKKIKGFPGYDLHITIAIVIGVSAVILTKACVSN